MGHSGIEPSSSHCLHMNLAMCLQLHEQFVSCEIGPCGLRSTHGRRYFGLLFLCRSQQLHDDRVFNFSSHVVPGISSKRNLKSLSTRSTSVSMGSWGDSPPGADQMLSFIVLYVGFWIPKNLFMATAFYASKVLEF